MKIYLVLFVSFLLVSCSGSEPSTPVFNQSPPLSSPNSTDTSAPQSQASNLPKQPKVMSGDVTLEAYDPCDHKPCPPKAVDKESAEDASYSLQPPK